jgi:hypothetical protein
MPKPNAQGSRVIIIVVQVGTVKIYVTAAEEQWRRSGKKKQRMKFVPPSKLVEKLVWVPFISFCKIFIPS